jgi:hypothetical protein
VFLVPDPGAAHLYLSDFVPDNLPDLKETIQQKYPDVKVGSPCDRTVEPRLTPPRSRLRKQTLRTKRPSLLFVSRLYRMKDASTYFLPV